MHIVNIKTIFDNKRYECYDCGNLSFTLFKLAVTKYLKQNNPIWTES